MASQTTTSTGEMLRHFRSLAGLTLQQVADGAGTAVAYLSKVERGQLIPTDDYVAKVTSYLSASMMASAA